MLIDLNKYVGNTVEIIYLDKKGRFSQRRIYVQTVEGDKVMAFCYHRRALRKFNTGNILAISPGKKRIVI